MTLAGLLKQTPTLSAAEHAQPAGSLLASLDDTEDASVEAAWDQETERRMQNVDSEKVKRIPLDEASQTEFRDQMFSGRATHHPDVPQENHPLIDTTYLYIDFEKFE